LGPPPPADETRKNESGFGWGETTKARGTEEHKREANTYCGKTKEVK